MVYVDNFQAKFRNMIMCHMIADTRQELLEMVDKIGVQRKWIQEFDTRREHFDICLAKKKLAIEFGAKEINMRELATMASNRNMDAYLSKPILNKPIRIQRKRTQGWKMPENSVSVCRPHKFGNPLKADNGFIYIDAGYRRKVFKRWVILCPGDVNYMLTIYKALLDRDYDYLNLIPTQNRKDLQHWVNELMNIKIIEELQGKNLACFCSLEAPCHADVLLSFVNDRIVG